MVKSEPPWLQQVTADERERLGHLGDPQLQSLFALQLGGQHGADWQTPGEIAAVLQGLGIATSAVGVRNTLDAAARAAPRRVIRSTSRRRSFRLAQPGERALAATGGGIAVVRIAADKPFTAREQLSEILRSLRGTVRVSDPYFGARSADALSACAAANEVRLITGKAGGGESESAARGVLVDLTKERKNVHVRIAPPGQIPHDRYLLTDIELIIVGNGLKDIGSRESFVIRLPRTLVGDIATQSAAAFDALWAMATPIAM